MKLVTSKGKVEGLLRLPVAGAKPADSEGRAFDGLLLASTFGAGGLCPRLQEEMADMGSNRIPSKPDCKMFPSIYMEVWMRFVR